MLAKASRATDTIEEPSGRVAALASIAGLLHRAGDVPAVADAISAALTFAGKIPEGIARASAFGCIAQTEAEIGGAQAARATIAKALATVPSTGSGEGRASALATIAKAQAATGDTMGALATAERVEDEFVRDRVLGEIGFLASSTGRYQEALIVSGAIFDCDRRAVSLVEVAEGTRQVRRCCGRNTFNRRGP